MGYGTAAVDNDRVTSFIGDDEGEILWRIVFALTVFCFHEPANELLSFFEVMRTSVNRADSGLISLAATAALPFSIMSWSPACASIAQSNAVSGITALSTYRSLREIGLLLDARSVPVRQ
jgi:hypothetical protein